ncbi:MAG: hypothetical protein GY801_02790 [bacterium]|nr:hypothetical protein [bacterium]
MPSQTHSHSHFHPALSFIVLCLALLFSCSAFAESWEGLSTAHFYIHYQPVDRRIVQQIQKKSAVIHQTITADIAYEPKRKIAVYLCPDFECFQQKQPSPHKAPQWAVGLAYPHLNRIVMRSALKPGEGGRIKPLEIFRHELAHIILEQALTERGGAPRWLSEGFSMYHAGQWTIHGQRSIEEVTLRGSFIPLSLLTTGFPADEQAARIAYAQSFSVVAFLLHEYDRLFFHKFIAALKRGMDTDTALRASFGMSAKRLELHWQASLKKRYSWFGYLSASGLFWFVLSLIFLLVYLLKRQQVKRIRQRWEEEEEFENLQCNDPESLENRGSGNTYLA